jgi:hypothetical protein
MKDLELIKKMFNNAYVIPKADWTKIANFYEFISGTELEELLPLNSRWGSPNKDEACRTKITNDISQFRDLILEMYTVIPFTPSIAEYRENITEWTLDPSVMVLSNDRNVNLGRKSYSQAAEFYSVLLANSHNLGLVVEGVFYENPCRLCKFVLNKIAGECEIYGNNRQGIDMCSPRLNFNAQLFTNRTVSTLQEVDYAEVLSIWTDDQKMEV